MNMTFKLSKTLSPSSILHLMLFLLTLVRNIIVIHMNMGDTYAFLTKNPILKILYQKSLSRKMLI